MLTLPLLVNLVEVQDQFIIPDVFGEKLAVTIDDCSPDTGVPNGNGGLSGNKFPIILSVLDLVVKESREKRSGTDQNNCGEQVKP